MTETERRKARIKVMGTVSVVGTSGLARVLAILPQGIIFDWDEDHKRTEWKELGPVPAGNHCHGRRAVVFVNWENVILPELPKAIPGMLYSYKSNGCGLLKAVGLLDGRVWHCTECGGLAEFNPEVYHEA